MTDIVAELGSNPSGGSATVQARFTALDTTAAGKVDIAGDTMTGMLTLPTTTPTANQAIRKAYADSTYVNVAGDTMTGALSMGGQKITNLALPTNDGDAANLEYVGHRVLKEGDIMSGALQIGGNPASATGLNLDAGTGSGFFSSNRATGPAIVTLRHRGAAASTGGLPYLRFQNSDAADNLGEIRKSGGGVVYDTTSDHRLKVAEGPCQDPAARIKALGEKAFQGRWIVDEGQGQAWDMLYAHDIDTVAPYAVNGAKDAVDTEGNPVYQSVDYSKLVPLLVAALSDALARIEALEAG